MRKHPLRTLSGLSRQAFCAAVAIGALTLSSAASANLYPASSGSEFVGRIKLADLDLTSDRGVDRLHRRLSLKARRYCRHSLPVGSPAAALRQCEEQVVAENTGKLHKAIDEAEAARALR